MSQLTDVKKFLKSFNPGTKLIKNTFLRSAGKASMTKTDLASALMYNKGGQDAYFVVNPGGSVEKDVNKLVACFVDLDAGRDSKGNYFSGATLKTRKAKMLNAISMFPLAASYIVETRNGYQVYWLLSNHKKDAYRLNRWNTVQQTIHKFFAGFGADKRVVKCNQIMRLPYTTWYKKWEKKPSVEVVMRAAHPSRKYKLEDFKYEWRNQGPAGGFVVATAPKNDWSYQYAARGVTAKPVDDKKVVKNGGGKLDLSPVIDTIAFLKDVNSFLYTKGSRFMAKSATTLADRLSSSFGVS